MTVPLFVCTITTYICKHFFLFSRIRTKPTNLLTKKQAGKNERKELHAVFQLATEPKTVQQAIERVSHILDALYEKANLVEAVKKYCCHLSKDRREEILKLLLQFEDLFDGTLGGFHTNPVHLDLKEGAVPKHHKPFPGAKIHEDTLKKELEQLV